MKVLYDHQMFNIQSYGGVSRIFYDLIRFYNNEKFTKTVEIDLAIGETYNSYLLHDEMLKSKYKYSMPLSKELFPNFKFRGKGRLNKVLKRRSIPPYEQGKIKSVDALQKGDFDLFHPTYYDPYFLDYIGTKPYVITVHDMIHEMFSEYMAAGEHKRILDKKNLVEKASHIITISENTKKDLLKFVDIPEDKVTVVHLYSDLIKTSKNIAESTLIFPNRFILYIGNRYGYKNFFLTVEAFKKLSERDVDICLVCVGGGNFNNDEKNFIKLLGVEDKVLHIGNDDEDIVKGYKNALAFIYPSLYEGFGIPIIEAFQFGCPVICSDILVFREVATDAAEYFLPKDINSITNSIEKVISDKEYRSMLIKKGEQRCKEFTLEKTAMKTLEVYKKVLKD